MKSRDYTLHIKLTPEQRARFQARAGSTKFGPWVRGVLTAALDDPPVPTPELSQSCEEGLVTAPTAPIPRPSQPVTPKVTAREYACPRCPATLPTLPDLREHLYSKHPAQHPRPVPKSPVPTD